jgi:hypothetical protein
LFSTLDEHTYIRNEQKKSREYTSEEEEGEEKNITLKANL